MGCKASTRGQKISPRQLTERELEDVNRALNAAGDWKQLRQQHKEWRKIPRPKSGPPKNTFFGDLEVTKSDWEGGYRVTLRLGGFGPPVWLFVRPRKRGVKPGGPFKTPHEAAGEIVEMIWTSFEDASRAKDLSGLERAALDKRRLGGGELKSIRRRLANEVMTRIRAIERV